jgi:hypothetical protein
MKALSTTVCILRCHLKQSCYIFSYNFYSAAFLLRHLLTALKIIFIVTKLIGERLFSNFIYTNLTASSVV